MSKITYLEVEEPVIGVRMLTVTVFHLPSLSQVRMDIFSDGVMAWIACSSSLNLPLAANTKKEITLSDFQILSAYLRIFDPISRHLRQQVYRVTDDG